MTTDTDAQDRAITHALTQEIQDIATDMITRGVEDGYVCSDRSNSNLSLQLLVATDLEIDLLDKQPGVHWHLKLKGASLESKAVEFDGGECFSAAALDALSDLYAEVENHVVCARGALLYGAELVARNDAAGDDIMSAIDPSLQDVLELHTQRIKQLEDKVDKLIVKSLEEHVPPAPAPAPEVQPEPVDIVTSDATTSASIINDAASLIEESRRRVFTAKGLAMTAPEVQLEPLLDALLKIKPNDFDKPSNADRRRLVGVADSHEVLIDTSYSNEHWHIRCGLYRRGESPPDNGRLGLGPSHGCDCLASGECSTTASKAEAFATMMRALHVDVQCSVELYRRALLCLY